MVSLSRLVLVVGLVLLVGGLASGSLGVYKQATTTCESGYGVAITPLEANETVDPTADHVAYSNLSAAEQQIFRDILTAETTPIYQNITLVEGLTQKVVTYHGKQYKTGPVFVKDCLIMWKAFKILGGLTALLGGVIVVATYGWRRIR